MFYDRPLQSAATARTGTGRPLLQYMCTHIVRPPLVRGRVSKRETIVKLFKAREHCRQKFSRAIIITSSRIKIKTELTKRKLLFKSVSHAYILYRSAVVGITRVL